MGHLNGGKEEAYQALAERLSRFPVGVVINETLLEILNLLYTAEEAQVGSFFPVKPRPFPEILKLSGLPEKQLQDILEDMAFKGLVIDIPRREHTYYMLSPVVVGFFEYSLMRADRANLKELAQLYEQYFNNRSAAAEIFGSDNKMFRALINERYIPALVKTEVLDYEKAETIIRRSGGGALSICACRHKNYHLGKPCRYPMEDICTSLSRPAEWIIRRGFGRRATVDELLHNLERSHQLGLVLTCDNVIEEPAYICHCCGCCCGPLNAIKKHNLAAVQPSNFKPQIDPDACLSCDACVDACHIDALVSSEAAEPQLREEICIGCGVCAAVCPADALTMKQREETVKPPRTKMEQMVNIAIEKGRF